MLTAILVVAAAALVALLTVRSSEAAPTPSAPPAAAAKTDTARGVRYIAAPTALTVFFQKLAVYSLLAASGSTCALALVVAVDILDSPWLRIQCKNLCNRSRLLARIRAAASPIYASDGGKELLKRSAVRAITWAKPLWDILADIRRPPPLPWPSP
jgi:Mn2+/Fe2+ NRAMP family transporter